MDRKTFVLSVVAGVVATLIFVALLDPIMRWFWGVISTSASSEFTRLQVLAFKNAALGKRDWIPTLLFLEGTLMLIGISLGMLVGLISLGLIWCFGWFEGVRRNTRVLRITQILLSILICWFVTYRALGTAFMAYIDLQLNASFNQRLDALGPYIDPIEERRFRSSWALMKSRSDYESINKRLDELGAAAKIELPEPLLK